MPGVLDDLPYETYTGPEPADWLLEKLIEYEEQCTDFLFDTTKIKMTAVDSVAFAAATHCYICDGAFDEDSKKKGDAKVRDHDHISGDYRGAAHSRCNLLKRQQRKIPVFFHNLRGYDEHILIPALGKHKDRKLRIIGQTMEKYMMIEFGPHLVFKDTLQFLSCSLEQLVANLVASDRDKFVQLKRGFDGDDDNIDLLLRKGIYPYEYMNSADRFKDEQLPPIEAFHSTLRNEKCTQEDYKHAERVWEEFGCTTFLDYHNIYLKCDVLHLADVFEHFRTVSLEQYSLDPAHYISAPMLAWGAMLRTTKCKLDLLTDAEMFATLQKNLRGGVSMISKRYAKANNKYMDDLHDPTQPSKYIMYWDANNLYGWAMSAPLPTGNFAWMSEEEWTAIDWLKQEADQPTGYFVECDLEYPDELHDLHNDYPLAAERLEVDIDMVSEKQRELRAEYDMPNVNKCTKLVPNLRNKTKYLCHYRNLRFYLEHGLRLTKVHRVIKFDQSPWLEPYITKNTNLRAAAKNKFEKEFFKLLNNAVYGKTCENVLKRSDIRLLTDARLIKELIAKPHCKGFEVFSEDIAAVSLQKVVCEIDKPMYIGFSVLELSKLLMYEFHYDWVLKQYPREKVHLLFTDTDSLVYEIETEDIFKDMTATAANSDRFDFSNYAKESEFYNAKNQMVVGKMKDEAEAHIITEVVALRPKMYSYKKLKTVEVELYDETKRAKGINRAVMKNIHFDDYKAQLDEAHENHVTMYRIGHKRHHLFTFKQCKRGLCAYDDKRYLLDDGISTLAHGNYKIRDLQREERGDDDDDR